MEQLKAADSAVQRKPEELAEGVLHPSRGTDRQEEWDLVITPNRPLWDLRTDEIWRYRDLLLLFVRRDFVAYYKQTILGPLWFLIQPILTTVIFLFVFNRLAGISTDGVPPVLFYLAGITCWSYFADSLNKTATTFKDNKQIFGKVYFARMVVPLSIVLSNLIKFGIQFVLFLGFLFYFLVVGSDIRPNEAIALLPLLILMMAGLGIGFGLIITSLTTKYRDLVFLLQFGVQLFMYATPVIYPLSIFPQEKQWIALLNPMASVIETFKYGFLGEGVFDWSHLAYSGGFTLILLFIGVVIFNRTERTFMDTI